MAKKRCLIYTRVLKASPGVLKNRMAEAQVSSKLVASASNGRIGELRKLLAAHPARLDALYACDQTDMTLMSVACGESQHGIVETLVALGASLDRAALDGRTPLMCAASHADVELVRLLLGYGANPLRTDDAGRDAAAHASLMGSCRPNDPTWARCVNQCVEMISSARSQRLALHARRRWRRAIWTVLLLRDWQQRAAERAYAPGGLGYAAAWDDFRENANATNTPTPDLAPHKPDTAASYDSNY